MPYTIKCNDNACGKETLAINIVELVNNHISNTGKLKCISCKKDNAYIYQKSTLQEEGEVWERYIKGVITIKTDYDTYTPYIFLTSNAKDGEINGIHFNYFKDTRNEPKGRLKHGHGPGGAPVLSKNEFFQLIDKLIDFGIMNKSDIQDFLNKK